MPIASRTFRIFVSSTFEDLVEERNALQREVFPVIRKLCEEHGARFQAIDLRWGVRDEAVLGQRMMETCLAEIERCQRTRIKPNFIVLLGDRYGRPPLPARVPQDEFEAVVRSADSEADRSLIESWYQRDDNAVPPEYLLKPRTGELVDAGRWREVEDPLGTALRKTARAAGLDSAALLKYVGSASHQEIVKGLGTTAEDRRHTLGFLRRTDRAKEPPELTALKGFLGKQLGENAVEYEVGEISNLCREITEKLSKVILDEMSRFESRTALELETEAHDALAQERSRHFTGRTSVLGAIADYLKRTDPRPLIVHGPSGSGKSAIMAKASEEHPGVRRFIGVTPASSNGLTLLRSLCEEIGLRYGQTGDLPATFNELIVLFQDRLKLASADRPLVVYLDALDQLNADDPAAAMDWMPRELPPHCRLVLSTIDIPARLTNAELVPVEPFSVEDAGSALDFWLADAKRTLQRDQRDKVLDSFRQTGLPLYLRLAFEEGRLWRSFDPPEKCTLGDGLAGIIDRLFARLSEPGNHGPVLVKQSLGFLAAARYGLTEDEMLDVLAADDEVWNDFEAARRHELPDGVRRLPVIVWSRLHLDIEPYLTERAVPGGTTISFYHRQLVERVTKDEANHAELARYFGAQSNWCGSQQANERRISELVRQQVLAKLLGDVESTLMNLDFVSAKCAAGLVFDLQEDYRLTISALPEAALSDWVKRPAARARWAHTLVECAREKKRPQTPEVVTSVHLWTEEQITSEGGRVTTNLTRIDRLEAFMGFVQQEAGPLLEFGKWPGFVAEHVFNTGPAAVVRELGSVAGKSNGIPRLLRVLPSSEASVGRGFHVRIFEGHGSQVVSIALSSDGRRALSGSANKYTGLDLQNKVLRLWDLDSGACLRTLEVQQQQPRLSHAGFCVALAADCRTCLCAGEYGLELWDLDAGTFLRAFGPNGHRREVDSIAVTPDMKLALSGSGRHSLMHTAQLWNVEDGECLITLEGHLSYIKSVAITPDGASALTGSEDKTLKLWNLKTGTCVLTLKGHSAEVNSVAMTADGRRALSAGSDSSIRFWDLETGQCLRELKGQHVGPAFSVDITPDGHLGVSGGYDKTVRIWDLETGACLRSLKGNEFGINAVAIQCDGARAVSGGDDGSVRLWYVEKGTNIDELREPMSVWGTTVAVTPDSRYGLSAAREVKSWDLMTGKVLRTVDTLTSRQLSVATRQFSMIMTDGRHAACWQESDYLARFVGDVDNRFLLVDLETGNQRLLKVLGRSDQSEPIEMSQPRAVATNGWRVVSSYGRALWVQDADESRAPKVMRAQNVIWCLAISPEGDLAVSGGAAGELELWDLNTLSRFRSLSGHLSGVRCIAFDVRRREILSGSDDNTLRVWHLADGECRATLAGHSGPIRSVALTSDGRWAVSASDDRTVRLWNLETAECVALACLNASCVAVACTATPDRLITATSLGDIFVFEMCDVC